MISTKQAAEILNESTSKVITLIKNGILLGKLIGRAYQIDQTSVLQYKDAAIPNHRKFDKNTKGIWGEFYQLPPVVKLCDNGITKFWNEHCEAVSMNMPLLPKETLPTQGYITETTLMGNMPNISPKVCVEPYMEYTKTDTKTETYHIYPPRNIKALWQMWSRETSRIYNFTINMLEKMQNGKFIGEYALRDKVKAEFNRNPTYPNTALEGAVNDARLAFQAGRPKSRIDGAFAVDGRCIRNGYLYAKNTKYAFGNKTESIKELKRVITKSICRVSFDATKDCFNLHVPVKITPMVSEKKQFISLDPGIRTFMTYYDGDSYGEIGAGFAKSLGSLMRAADRLHAKISEIKNKRKKQIYQKAHNRITRKITNKVKDLHYKTAKFLGKYENIFLPDFRVKPLAEKLGPKTTRELYALSHFKFKQHLAFKTAEFKNRIIVCNEAYTSKTCTACGKIHPDLGASKTYTCTCGVCHDRDYNGARNIAIRVLTYGLTHSEYTKNG